MVALYPGALLLADDSNLFFCCVEVLFEGEGQERIFLLFHVHTDVLDPVVSPLFAVMVDAGALE